jgi:hypothetical protein
MDMDQEPDAIKYKPIQFAHLYRTLERTYGVSGKIIDEWDKEGKFQSMKEGDTLEIEYEGRKLSVRRERGFAVEGESEKE